ncbi:MAG: heat shock protein HspQ [Planctomycetota bacterium]|jgi:heat shock protein HspQ
MIMIRKPVRDENGSTRFQPGDLVRHRRYGYRGVVVEADTHCQASQAWYGNNQTQPSREQAWYHVLVHGSHQSTYAADSSLEADTSQESISHPLLGMYFESFLAGVYQRNDREWGV